MNKKVCFISTTSITMKCFIVPIAHELAKAGLNVTLVCSDDNSMNEICSKNGLRFHSVKMGRGIDLTGIRAIREIKRFLQTEHFDLVQYCTPNAACYTSIAAKIARVPIRLYCQWGIRYVGLSGLSRTIFKQIEKLVCRLSTHIRSVSWKNLEFAVSEGLYRKEKAQVVGNGGTIGVDMSLFDITRKTDYCSVVRNIYGISNEAFVYGFCGRLSRDKGSNELIAAFKKMYEYDNRVRLLIVGDIESNTNIDELLLQWAKQSDCVVFTGKIPQHEVHKYYAPMNVLVHPTYREGFGMVIQEAGAYGIPCITTNIPGASEVMEDKVSCLLVNDRDVETLFSAMKCLFIDRELTEKLGEASYQRTKELYNRSIMLNYQKDDYLKLLEDGNETSICT